MRKSALFALFILFPAIAAAQPFIFTPEVVVAEATGPSGANVTYDVGVFSFTDPNPTLSCTPASGALFPLGTTNVHCTATDSGGTSSADFPILVTDTTPPVLTLPAPFTSASTTVTYTATATDTVDGPITPDCSPASGTVFPVGTTVVNCSATDAHQNVTFGSFVVAVVTPSAPTLTLPADFSVGTEKNTTGTPVVFDVSADQEATIVCNPASGSFFLIGTTTVTCTATNAFNVSSSGSFHVTVFTDPTPTLILPGDIFANADTLGGAVVTYTPTATDAVDGTDPVTCTPVSGSTFPVGGSVVQCSATNTRGFTSVGTFNVFVIDSTPPVLSLPTSVFVPSGGSPEIATYTATATDVVDGPVPVDCQPPSGSLFPFGQTTVNCTAADLSGNTASGSFIVTVGDTVPPVITVPADITAEATSPAGAMVSYTVTAVDNVDGPVIPTCTPSAGSTFPLGTTTVTCTAHDNAGNVATASFHITVVDTTPPTLHLPAPITVSADANCQAVVTYTATATDLVDVTDPVVCTPASGSTFQLGPTTVNCTSTDAHNNTAHGSFTVTVVDTTPPTIQSITASPSNLWPDNHELVNVTLTVVATDNCDPAPVSTIIGVTSNQPIISPGSGNTNPDFVITGNLTLQLRAERTQGQDRTYTITITTTDSSGNTSLGTVTVTVSQTSSSRNRAIH